MSSSGLKNSSVIVTGAASGIGRATALRFAREGAKVVAADLNHEGTKTIVEQIRAAGATAEAVSGDLSDPAVIERVVSTAVTEFGGVDVLANIAGVIDSQSAAADVTDAEWERIIRINLTAPFMLTRAVLPHMLAKGKGAIVNTGSTASLRGSRVRHRLHGVQARRDRAHQVPRGHVRRLRNPRQRHRTGPHHDEHRRQLQHRRGGARPQGPRRVPAEHRPLLRSG